MQIALGEYIVREDFCQSLVRELKNIYKQFPEIAVKIESYWGRKAGHEYLQLILNKDRDTRSGFPSVIFYQLLHIYCMHVSCAGDFDNPLILVRPNLNLNELMLDNSACIQYPF